MSQHELLRDAKSGRMLSRLETEAKLAAQAVEGYGLPKESQKLIGLKQQVESESQAVRDYVEQAVSLVRDFSGPINELKKVQPLLAEINTFAAQDKTLTDSEKRRIANVVKELQTHITKKTSLFTRTRSTLKSVSRKGASRLRDSAVELGENSDSGLLRLGAKVLSRREKPESDEKSILQTRADFLDKMFNRKQSEKEKEAQKSSPKVRGVKGSKGKTMSPEDFSKEPEFEKPKSPKKKREQEERDDQSALLTHILDTERDVLTELKTLTKVLKNQTDDIDHERDAQARRDEEQLESLTKLSPKPVAKTDVSKKTDSDSNSMLQSLLSTLGFGEIGDVVKGFIGAFGKIATLVGETLLPALTLMASGAAVIGAAFAGWEFGKWLDEKAGNKLSDAVGRAAAFLMGGTDQLNAYDDMRKAQEKAARDRLNAGTAWGDKQRAEEQAQAAKSQQHANTAPMPTSVKIDTKTLGQVPDKLGVKTPDAPKPAAVAPPVTPATTSTSPTKQPYVLDTTPYGPETPKSTSPTKVAAQDISDTGVEFIKDKEKFSSKPYSDKTGLAIGYGSHMYKGRSIEAWVKENPNFTITKADAENELHARLKNEFVPAVRKSLKRPVSQSEFDALVSIAYNRGVGRFHSDKEFLGKVNSGTATADDFKNAHGALKGNDRKGVEGRRSEEFAMYTGDTSSPSARKTNVSNRNAGPIASMTAAANKSSAPVVVAPTNIASNGGSGGSMTFVPVPVRPKNVEPTFRAIQTINEV
jgi:lysozyme